MTKIFRVALAFLLIVVGARFLFAQAAATNNVVISGETKPKDAALNDSNAEIADPLIRMLITKGILSPAEAHLINAPGTPIEQRDRLATLLRDKGVISSAEYEAVRARATDTYVTTENRSVSDESKTAKVETAVQATPAPKVVAAIAPVRLLPLDLPKREGLIPDIKLGSGARVKLYGFFKTSIIHDLIITTGKRFSPPVTGRRHWTRQLAGIPPQSAIFSLRRKF